jgi:hypothetical protein
MGLLSRIDNDTVEYTYMDIDGVCGDIQRSRARDGPVSYTTDAFIYDCL